jgi:cell division transport system permease protein
MKIETMLRHIREAYRGIRRNTWMSFAAMSSVSVTLFIFGIFLLTAFNIRFVASELDKQVAIRVSLNPSLTKAQQKSLEKKIQEMPEVKLAKFISKEEGLKEMREKWGKDDNTDVFKGMDKDGENPLPDMIHVQPKDPQRTEALAKRFEKMGSGINEVDYAHAITNQILGMSKWLQNIVLIFGLGLGILASFVISNTIKLTILARRKEIEIQRLVGASNWFIRWPFFYEGAFIGLVGAVVPAVLVLIFYQAILIISGPSDQAGVVRLIPIDTLIASVGGSIFLLGAAIGIGGSIISIHRFLRI